jgi:hypothetical protein
MRRRIDAWRALPGCERRLLVRLALVLPLIGAVLRLAGLRRTYGLLHRLGAADCDGVGDMDAARAAAVRVAALVSIAARHGPLPAGCLPQSLALWWLLHRRGVPATLRIGIRLPEGGARAHAWVELQGRAIGERAALADRYVAYQGLDRRLAAAASKRDFTRAAQASTRRAP